MRVVLTTNFSPWSAYSGGGQRSTHHLACALSHRGHDVSVVFTKTPWERIEPPEPLPYRIRWAALYHFRSQSQAPLRPLTALTVAREVEALCNDGEPLIVQGQGEEAAAIPRLARRRAIGFVLTSRYPDLPDVWLSDPPASRWKKWAWTLILPKYANLGVAARGAATCCPPSHFGGDLLRRAYDIPRERIEPVHNGVPDAFLEYRWSTRTDDKRPLLFFGRFAHSKGIDTLLAALARLGKDAPRLRVVGKGPDEGKLRTQARTLGIEERLEWLPWADHDTLGRLLEDTRAVALPSREENFSLAVLSCMAVGTPLITTDVGGTLEVAENGVNCLVCPAGDVGTLEQALRRILEDPEAALERASRARERVRRDFTWDAAAAHFERIYERVLPDAV